MSDATIDGLTAGELATVVEMQRVELNRLLGEQRRLNDRLDQMLRLQEREQVLRQQMQASLDRLADQRSIGGARDPSSDGKPAAPQPQLVDRLHRTERKFSALQNAVGQLVDLIERNAARDKSAGPGGGHVRVFVPGAPDA
jgi:hypothetical protein